MRYTMRVTGGMAGGIELLAPKGGGTRPATDRMREAVFSTLGDVTADARVVDLFAGTGAYGLEAWSRGAAQIIFVENHARVAGILKKNIERVARSLDIARSTPVRLLRRDALAASDAPESADLVFADPPYGLMPGCFTQLFARSAEWLDPSGSRILVLEAPGELDPREHGWSVLRRLGRGRGQPTVTIFRFE